ncbi:uncharacterized protein LOC144621989 [Crassostrea virginica]
MKETIRKTLETKFNSPFESVVAAHKQLFSEKGKIEKIIEIEEKNVSKSKDGTEEKVERTLYKRPSKHLKGKDNCMVVKQTNILNKRSKTLKVESRNTNFTDEIEIIDSSTFTVDPENSQCTLLQQEYCIHLYSLKFGISSTKVQEKHEKTIKKFYDLIKEEIQHLPSLESREMGNPLDAKPTTDEKDIDTEIQTESNRDDGRDDKSTQTERDWLEIKTALETILERSEMKQTNDINEAKQDLLRELAKLKDDFNEKQAEAFRNVEGVIEGLKNGVTASIIFTIRYMYVTTINEISFLFTALFFH